MCVPMELSQVNTSDNRVFLFNSHPVDRGLT